MLLSTYGERGRHKFNEDSRYTEIDEISTIHKPKSKSMFCSNNAFYFFPCVHSTCQTQPQYCCWSVLFLSFVSALDRLCRKRWLFCPTTWTDHVLLKNPVEHLARAQHWLTKEKLRLIKSSLTGACSRWLCEGGNCSFKQWAACHPQHLHQTHPWLRQWSGATSQVRDQLSAYKQGKKWIGINN